MVDLGWVALLTDGKFGTTTPHTIRESIRKRLCFTRTANQAPFVERP